MKNENIQQLMLKFKISEHYKEFHAKRMKDYEYNHSWIQPEQIKEIRLEELNEKFREYYKGGEGRQEFNNINYKKIMNDLPRFKQAILILLDESISLESRFTRIVSTKSEDHINQFGKALASAFLMDYNSDKYGIWNGKVESGLNVLGWDAPNIKSKSVGSSYLKVLDYLTRIRDILSGPNLNYNFDDVDSFLHWIAAEDEGKKAIKQLISSEAQYWLIRAGEKGKLWNEWKERKIITIGWDIGEDLQKLSNNDIKTRLEEKNYSDAGRTSGFLRKFAGIHEEKNFKKGDYIIVLGDASILGIAQLINNNPYIYHEGGLENEESHTYWKFIEYIFDEGPIRLLDLPAIFKDGGECYIHLVPTLNSYEIDRDNFEILRRYIFLYNLIQKFINFSKKIKENDENVKKISDLIRNSDKALIQEYSSNFFNKFLIRNDNIRNVIPFYRIMTINKIISNKDSFQTLKQVDLYSEEFKNKMKDNLFPESFREELEMIKDVPTFKIDEVEYDFNYEFVEQYIQVVPDKINRQFGGYKGFRYFRHFMLYTSEEGTNLREKHQFLWLELDNYLIKLLGLNREEYFIDSSDFFKDRYEIDYTWAAFSKKNIGDLDYNEEKTETFQFYFNIKPHGLDLGTYMGVSANEQLEGFISNQIDKKKNELIDIFRYLKEKYKDKIQLQAVIDGKGQRKTFKEDLNSEETQDNLIEFFKVNFEILYNGYNGRSDKLDEIIVDLFKIYELLTEEPRLPEDIPNKFVEDNLKIFAYIVYKEEIVEELKKYYIGMDLDNIVEKILKLLDSGKHIILYGSPGTGKTEILEKIFKFLTHKLDFIKEIVFTTACSDWTDFETIGGLIPVMGSNQLAFKPGLILRCFGETTFTNKWLIIDELNRANIDKAFGYFLSILSNQEVELPYSTISGKKVKIIPFKKWQQEGMTDKEIIIKKAEATSNYHRYFISPNWRIGGTINSSDKASLYQLSHAFIRRFGFVHIPLPEIEKFMENFEFKSSNLKKKHIKIMWNVVNNYYKIGPAIIIDIDKFLANSDILNILDAFEAFILPQIDTLPIEAYNNLLDDLVKGYSEDNQIEEKKFEKFKIHYNI